MNPIRVPLDWPNIGESEKKSVLEALESGWVSTAGPLVQEFERRFGDFLGVRQPVATASGTCALYVALKVLGVGPGDEVIVPALTFVATVNPVLHVGATPVIVDVDPKTWTIDPKAVEAAITQRTKGIIPVHLYGNPADMTSLMALAERHGLFILEDAAESLGSTLKGQLTGTIGDVGVFSFNGNKVITTGNGGMLVFKSEALARRARSLVNQARVPSSREYDHEEAGFNYRLTNLQSALGLAQIKRLPEFLNAKRMFSQLYRRLFEESGVSVTWQHELPGASSNWWLFSVVLREGTPIEQRVSYMERVSARGVQVRPLFKPLTLQSYLNEFVRSRCPVSESLHARGINVPSATFLTEQDIRTAFDVLIEELPSHG